MNNFITQLSCGVAVCALAVSLPSAGKADPKMIGSGTDKTKLTISGHVNRGVMVVDDGDDTEVYYVDVGTSESRMTLRGDGKISEDLSVKAVIELRFEENGSDLVSQSTEDAPTAATDRGVGIRHSYLSFSSKKFGTLTTGQASDAGDNVMGADLSGTFLAGTYSEFTDIGYGMAFKTNAGAASSVTLGGAWLVGDGTRDDMIRYDSPSFGGLSLHASIAQGERKFYSATYSAAYDGLKVSAALRYGEGVLTNIDDQVIGSISALHDSGISATFAFSSADKWETTGTGSTDSVSTLYGKLGYQASLFDVGKSFFAIGYGVSDDSVSNGSELEAFQVGYVQSIDAAATELYLGVTHASFEDSSATTYEDIVTGIMGARVKF